MEAVKVVKNECLVCGTGFDDNEVVMFVGLVGKDSLDRYIDCEDQEPRGGIHERCFNDRVKPVEVTA